MTTVGNQDRVGTVTLLVYMSVTAERGPGDLVLLNCVTRSVCM